MDQGCALHHELVGMFTKFFNQHSNLFVTFVYRQIKSAPRNVFTQVLPKIDQLQGTANGITS
jgi:hypothetical protein